MMNEAELLFSELLGCDRAALVLNKKNSLSREKASLISSVLKRRIKGEPLAYILQKTEFMGLEFMLNQDVFIPRQETEILVETVLDFGSGFKVQGSELKILDLGTGSGCIAVSLARFMENCGITATDISPQALKIAEYNAIKNNVADKIVFMLSDLFTGYGIRDTGYDIIVSNPPYVLRDEIKNLQPEVRREPLIALDGGDDGLDFYRKIIKAAPQYLKDRGLLFFEIGYGQRSAIEDIFSDCGKFRVRDIIKDYSGIERVIFAEKTSV